MEPIADHHWSKVDIILSIVVWTMDDHGSKQSAGVLRRVMSEKRSSAAVAFEKGVLGKCKFPVK